MAKVIKIRKNGSNEFISHYVYGMTELISWIAKKSNETVFLEAGTISLINRIRKCQATFFGHVMRREILKHLVTTGMIQGKISRKDVEWTNKVA